MDAETRAFLEKNFGLVHQELERTNSRLAVTEAETRKGFEEIREELERTNSRLATTDAETRAFFEKYFGLIQQELERTNVRLTAVEDRLTAVEDRLSGLEKRVGGLEDRSDSHEQAIESLRLEMRERFISTDKQLRTLTLRMQHFEARVEDAFGTISRDVAAVREDVAHLTVRTKNVETGIADLNARVDTLADDMRQRFRSVQERLGNAA